eukprot:SAG11_NODE_5040_length_1682_cov_2.234997_2_plen_190_part_00
MDVGCQIPHGALRFYVMGDRGANHVEEPTAAECAEMRRLVAEALRSGARGFTTVGCSERQRAPGAATAGLKPAKLPFTALHHTDISDRRVRTEETRSLHTRSQAITLKHLAADGRVTPGYSAFPAELEAIALGMRDAGSGIIEANLTDMTGREDLAVRGSCCRRRRRCRRHLVLGGYYYYHGSRPRTFR